VSKKPQQAKKERGTWLTLWLVLIAIHGVFASTLIWYLRNQEGLTSPWWVWVTLFLTALADIVAAIVVWNWKRLGLWLYAISTTLGIVAGLVLTASQLVVFHDIVPLVILGWLVKDKQSYFS
jgi:hypothetical protein